MAAAGQRSGSAFAGAFCRRTIRSVPRRAVSGIGRRLGLALLLASFTPLILPPMPGSSSGPVGGAALAAGRCSPERIDLRPAPGSGTGEGRSSTRQSFAVEIADTAAARALGLMYRESLAPDAGMLFIYESPRRAEFWMKNTLIPLDIIFADAAGRVTVVHENAIPGDLTPIPGGDAVLYVLEINAGLARKTGIIPGSEMRHPRITSAAWPCS